MFTHPWSLEHVLAMESIYKNGEDSYKEIISRMQLQYKALDTKIERRL